MPMVIAMLLTILILEDAKCRCLVICLKGKYYVRLEDVQVVYDLRKISEDPHVIVGWFQSHLSVFIFVSDRSGKGRRGTDKNLFNSMPTAFPALYTLR